MEKSDEYKNIPLTITFVLTLFVNIPQLWKTWKTKDVSGFSSYTIVMRLFIQIAFAIYGVMEADVIIIIMSIEVFCCELLLLVFKWMYSCKLDEKSVELVHSNVPMEPYRGVIREGQTRNGVRVLVASV